MGEWDELPTFGDDADSVTAVVGLEGLDANEVSQRPFLIILSGDDLGRTLPVSAELLLGRGEDAGLRLTGDGVSRRHARIFQRVGVTLIEDLGSTNGTYINSRRIRGPFPLSDGDKIQLGGTFLLKFSMQDEREARFQRNLYEAALQDPLTKAYNRRGLLAHLDREIVHARRLDHELCLALFDLDHFKRLNDSHGHLAGDAVLERFAALVMEMTRKSDYFARYGGEEFVLVCRDTALAPTVALADRIRQRVAAHPFSFEDRRLSVTVSVGVGAMPAAATPDAMIALADEALYAAKSAGRDRVVARRSG